jgi:hypothetical protein
MQLSLPFETAEIRKEPHDDAPATHLPYVRKSPSRRMTEGLPIGTQERFIDAAMVAAGLGCPLNTFLTIRWRSMFSDNDVNALRVLPSAERIRHLVELLRKWIFRKGAPPVYIWARENADSTDEHWHMAFHLTKKRRRGLIDYVVNLTGEPVSRRKSAQATEGEFARGVCGSWQLAGDMRPEREGVYLAAYLGKGEPSQRMFRGKLVDNDAKPYRGRSFGGTFDDGRYDIAQGRIEGTASRDDRFFIANALKKMADTRCPKKTAAQAKRPIPIHGKSNSFAKTRHQDRRSPHDRFDQAAQL